jgi:tetratricopeptide (TPR) repeat protein
MRSRVLLALLFLLPASALLADFVDVVKQADALHDQGMYGEARTLLLDAAVVTDSGKEKAELYWRAARETLELGDQADTAKKPSDAILGFFVEGEAYSDKAIEADPENDLGYFWKSANIGRWGQVKGVFNALSKAAPIRDLLLKVLDINPDRSDAYFVLGQLYRELPGWPISFGNTDWAASLGRKAVDLNAEQVATGTEKNTNYDFSTELAKTLHQRGWSASTRLSEQKKKEAKYAEAKTVFEKGCLYEAVVALKDLSDAQEAKEIVQQVVASMEMLPSLTKSQMKDYRKAKDILKGW